MEIKYNKESDIYGDHKIIECKPCCYEMAELIKDYISEELINSMTNKCPFCKEKIILIEINKGGK